MFLIATISSLMYYGYQLNAYLAHILQFAVSVRIYVPTIFYIAKLCLSLIFGWKKRNSVYFNVDCDSLKFPADFSN